MSMPMETQALATGEQFSLFSRYVLTRHRDGDMADMDFDDYRAMVEESPVETAIVEFRDDSADGRLVGACLVDWLSNGVSAVYSFFDPQDPRRGLGTHMILWLANAAAKTGPALRLSSATGSPIRARWPTSVRLPAAGILRSRGLDGTACGIGSFANGGGAT
jgi:hypothetical protein